MQSDCQQNLLQTNYKFILNNLTRFKDYLQEISKTQLDKLSQNLQPLQPYFEKAHQFYQNHKDVILIVTAATVTYTIVKLNKKTDIKIKKTKTNNKQQLIERSFISDNEQGSYIEDTTTTKITPVHSEKEKINRKKKVNEKIYLQRIESSSSEQEGQDKIFFEVYKTYQVA